MSYSFSIFLKDFVSQNAFKAQSAIGRISESVNNTTSRLQRFSSLGGKSLDSLNEKLRLQNASRGANTSVQGIMRLNRSIRETEASIRKLENLPPLSFIDRIKKAGSSLGGLIGIAGGLAILTAGFAGLKGVAYLGMDAEDTRIKFEVMLGSATKAKSMLSEITQYANSTPFGSSELKQSAELMLNFGISAEKIMPSMKMLGDVSGGNKERLGGLTLAFSQMSATGRLMGQDLNQMINAGFNPLQVISQNTGISMGKLKDQMEAGRISVGMIEESFKLATGPGGRFNGMMEKVAKSARGQMSTAIDAITTKLMGFGEKYLVPIVANLAVMATTFFESFSGMAKIMQPFFEALMPLWDAILGFTNSFFGLDSATNGTSAVISFLNKTLSLLTPVLTVIINGITSAISILTPFAPLIKILAISWGLWNVALVIFNFLLYANPIGLIIGGIVILIGLIATAWQKFDTFRAVVMGAWEAIKGFGLMIKNYIINRFKELLSGITGIGQALMYFFKGDFTKAWEAGKKAAGDLIGVGSASKLIEDGKNVAGKVGAAYNAEFNKKTIPKVAQGAAKTKATADAIAPPVVRSKAFDLLGNGDKTNKGKTKGQGGGGSKSSSDGIIGGGSKITHITVNLAKMQDQIVINTVNTGEGATKLRQILEEELNRLLGSISQMQTA